MKQSTVRSTDKNPNPVNKNGLCLLSFDGGGVRGLSSLHILKRIMDEINRLREERGLPTRLPFEVFDMIGGTSTGGLIAIMLGRLEMSVDDCIKVYEELMGSIFGTKAHLFRISPYANINAQYDAKKVKMAIEKVLHDRHLPEDSVFNDGIERRCRVFVCCVAMDTTTAVRIRSYNRSSTENVPATIVQAALATSAATSFFEPVTIGSRQYVDGALRHNNPVTEVEAEARHLWCSDQVELSSVVKCFVSIGTGTPAKVPISYSVPGFLNNLKSLVVDTEAIHQSFLERSRRLLNEKRLFRFDVAQGLQNVDTADHQKQGLILEATDEYMDEGDQQIKVQDCTQNLMEKELQGTPLDFHETFSSYTFRTLRYPSKEIDDCRAVLRVTDVEKDKIDLINNKGTRVPGTFEWITTDTTYQNWRDSGPDALWITAGPGRGKTMLSLFILEELERYISSLEPSFSSITQNAQDAQRKNADLYYFFCSSEQGSRQSAISVFRTLIYQIVSKHSDLMTHVLDYLENNRPMHTDSQLDSENEMQSRNQEKKEQRSHSVGIQNATQQQLPTQPNFVKNFFRSSTAAQGTPENKQDTRKDRPQEEAEERSKSKSSMLKSMLGRSRKEDQSKQEPEKPQDTQPKSDTTDPVDLPERDSPKSRQLELLDVSELSFILRGLIRELEVDTVFFLLDGVDECLKEELPALILTLLKLQDVDPGKFKILVVSQPIGGMTSTPKILLEKNKETTGDIEKFIRSRLEQLTNIEGFSDIQQEVEENLLNGAEGTFLWISLVMREIETKTTCKEILATTKSVPQGLNNTYRHMLDRIDQQKEQQKDIYQILRWVTAAFRPLTLHELSEIIETPSSDRMAPEQVVRDVVKSAEGILKIRGNEVTFVHSSARSFLLRDETNNDGGEAGVALNTLHGELAQFCYDDIQRTGLMRSELKISELSDKDEPKMSKYAIRYWMDHVKASNWAEKSVSSNEEFFRADSRLRKNWWTAYLQDTQKEDPKHFNVASLLHLSAYFGITPWAKRAFDDKAWVGKKTIAMTELDHYYRTPLHVAVEQGHGSLVPLLLEHGFDIESREASLFATPLHLAARNGHKDICEKLLKHNVKAKINARNRFYSTPLTEAARGGHSEVVTLLVQEGADMNGSIDKKQRSLYRQMESLTGKGQRVWMQIEGLKYAKRSTPIIEAARKNHAEIIRYLFRNGANIEAQNLDGFNALHIAAYNGQLKSVECLVDLGANIEKKDNSTQTALFMAAWQNRADVVDWLLNHDADVDSVTNWGFTPLVVAARNGYVEPMRILTEAGAKIEHRDEDGYTSLAVAARFGKKAAVNFLIDQNVKVNAQDHAGNIPLMHAIQETLTDVYVETIQLLLKNGANVNHKNHQGLTPLMKAAKLSNGDAPNIMQHLLDRGATVSARDNKGRTAFMLAFKGGSNKSREFLLNNGVTLETKDSLGDTALIIAAGYSNSKAVEFLLDRGADIEARDKFGLTPLMKAVKCGYDDSVNLLLDRGAQIGVIDKEDKSAIDHAATRERGNMIKLLKSRGASRHNLTVINRAAATLSNVMYWTEEACRDWERKWEIAELKKLGKVVHDDEIDVTNNSEQREQEIIGETRKGSDADSEKTKVEPTDENNAKAKVEEKVTQAEKGTEGDEPSKLESAPRETESVEGDIESDVMKESEQK